VTPATWPRDEPSHTRLLRIDAAAETLLDARLDDLPAMLRAGDVLVVNDAATLPAALHGTNAEGAAVEVRLAGGDGHRWQAVLFGAGDWRMRTEDRAPPPLLGAGDSIRFGHGLSAVVAHVHPASRRLVTLRFDRQGDALWRALYASGNPVQYSYLRARLDLWHVQTPFGSRPWAFETPSAGRSLTWALLLDLARRGVQLVHVTHAAGLSSTGDPATDALLPLPERYLIPEATVQAIESARTGGGRVVAVGTTVVRALEGSGALHGRLTAGEGVTDLRIDAAYRPVVVDGLLTGIHEPGTSHFSLLTAFAPAALLCRAYEHAERDGYLGHEFGDCSLVLAEEGCSAATRYRAVPLP
jgi:S-adenosylmethionine:tRNA ribosyltransferase-isomerase